MKCAGRLHLLPPGLCWQTAAPAVLPLLLPGACFLQPGPGFCARNGNPAGTGGQGRATARQLPAFLRALVWAGFGFISFGCCSPAQSLLLL